MPVLPRTRALVVVLVLAAVLVAAGLVLRSGLGLHAGGSSVEPGPEAGSKACTALIARLPARVLDRPRSGLAVAGAAAWGDPAVVLRCGVTPGGPTSDPCIEANGVDWTFSMTGDDYRFRTYGRSPAVEVVVPGAVSRTSATAALIDLQPTVSPLPATAHCT